MLEFLFLTFFNYIYFRQTLYVDGCISSRNTSLTRSSWTVIVELYEIELTFDLSTRWYHCK